MQLGLVGLFIGMGYCESPRHLFSVNDSIQMTTFNTPSELGDDGKCGFSPNGKYFAVVTSKGLLQTNQVQSVLGVYDANTVRRFLHTEKSVHELKPRQLAKLVAVPSGLALRSYSSLISDLRWSSDSRSLYFRGQAPSGEWRLYRVMIHGDVIQTLSPPGYDVQRFDIAGDTVISSITPSMRHSTKSAPLVGATINPDARSVTGLPIQDILFPDTMRNGTQYPVTLELWLDRDGHGKKVPISSSDASEPDLDLIDLLSLSPDGHRAVRLLPITHVPDSWREYQPRQSVDYMRIHPHDIEAVSPFNVFRLKRYVLVNLDTGHSRPLINAPNAHALGWGTFDRAIWGHSDRLLLTNTFLPLNVTDSSERARRTYPCYVAEVDLWSLATNCIAFSHSGPTGRQPSGAPTPLSLRDVRFGSDDNEVVLQLRGSGGTVIESYRNENGTWHKVRSVPGRSCQSAGLCSPRDNEREALEITIRQTLNCGPSLWARDPRSGASKQLWNPNPQLARQILGEASVYHWKDRNGYAWTAGLIKPVDFEKGKEYPLVVQTHGFGGQLFKIVTDGSYPTAMAARPLASAGIMVLQVPDHPEKESVTSEEARHHIEGIIDGIDQLVADGLVDPKRVGIIGFSRTCWYVESALISYPHVFAAATIADGVDESYMQYHLLTGSRTFTRELEKINQARPFGAQGLSRWLQEAPSFHLDVVETPLRIEAIGPMSLLMEWEIYSSLREQSKPVDLIYIPDGEHILQKPWDRVASQQGNVDWFRFWLQGYEDPNPHKSMQYRLWENLRQLRNSQTAAH